MLYTRIGSIDFVTKPKITLQDFMPGVGSFYRTTLLSEPVSEALQEIPCIHQLQIYFTLTAAAKVDLKFCVLEGSSVHLNAFY